jgi:hypothetical protein
VAPGSKLRLAIELLVALAAILFLTASLIWPDWIEKASGFAPDNGDGDAEWGVSFAAVAVFLLASWLARREWRALPKAGSAAAQRGEA